MSRAVRVSFNLGHLTHRTPYFLPETACLSQLLQLRCHVNIPDRLSLQLGWPDRWARGCCRKLLRPWCGHTKRGGLRFMLSLCTCGLRRICLCRCGSRRSCLCFHCCALAPRRCCLSNINEQSPSAAGD